MLSQTYPEKPNIWCQSPPTVPKTWYDRKRMVAL